MTKAAEIAGIDAFVISLLKLRSIYHACFYLISTNIAYLCHIPGTPSFLSRLIYSCFVLTISQYSVSYQSALSLIMRTPLSPYPKYSILIPFQILHSYPILVPVRSPFKVIHSHHMLAAADVAIVFLSTSSSEGSDRSNLNFGDLVR